MKTNEKISIGWLLIGLFLGSVFTYACFSDSTSENLCQGLVPKEAKGIKILEPLPKHYSCIWYMEGNLSGSYEQHSAWLTLSK